MSYRNHPACLTALNEQGYLEESENNPDDLSGSTLNNELLAKAIKGQLAVVHTNLESEFNDVALTEAELIEKLFPGFLTSVAVSQADTEDPTLKDQVAERAQARKDMGSLLWGELSKTTESGKVQMLYEADNLVLIEHNDIRRPVLDGNGEVIPGEFTKHKGRFATDNEDLVIKFFVGTRSARVISINSAASADVNMAQRRLPGSKPRIRATFGVAIDSAILELMTAGDARLIDATVADEPTTTRTKANA
jgi:hypothetical protein